MSSTLDPTAMPVLAATDSPELCVAFGVFASAAEVNNEAGVVTGISDAGSGVLDVITEVGDVVMVRINGVEVGSTDYPVDHLNYTMRSQEA